MTIAAKSGTLTKVLITYDGVNKPDAADVVDGGTYDPSTGMWTGNAEKVVFTRPSGSGHWRVKAIATGNDAQGPETPTEGQTAETAITVTRALELINALEDGKSTDFTYYVKGYVTSIKSITSSGASFFIGETADATNTVQTYNLKGLGNQAITNTGFVKAGDLVVVYGTLQKYKASSGTITPEVTSGYVYSVNGSTEDKTPNPEDAVTGGTQESPLSVTQALDYIEAFPSGFTTTNEYYVKGIVSNTPKIDKKDDGSFYGNADFSISEGGASTRATATELVIYHAKGLEKKSIDSEDYLKSGDEVIICGKLQNYNGTTPEMSSCYIYSLNGQTSSVGALKADADTNAARYNVAGQKVDEGYKGLVINGGKKLIQK